MKSPSMWLKKLRRQTLLISMLLVSLLLCLVTMARHYKTGYIDLTAYKKFELRKRVDQRPLQMTSVPNSVPDSVPTGFLASVFPNIFQTNISTTERKKVEPEKGLYNFTVVTALMDIGRGSWKIQVRSYEKYLSFMEQVLRLEVNMVVYIDAKGKSSVERMRRGKETHTRINIVSLVDLPFYRYRARIAEIMESEEYKKDNELVALKLCESYSPEYDIVQFSKLYFINRTIWENPFSTSYFMWIDSGYAHGRDVFPKNNVWIPKNLFEFSDKVTFMERYPGVKLYENMKAILHKRNINILAGNFFGGGARALKELCEMQKVLVEEWMRNGVVDDDQTTYMLMYYRKPSLFHLVPADWYDVFNVFNTNTTGSIKL